MKPTDKSNGRLTGMSDPRTVLFVDWSHVGKGKMHPTLDPDRISEDGKKQIDQHYREYGIIFKLTGHSMEPIQLPYGIRITIEKARKSEPWLSVDKPWEEYLNFFTVMHDEGRYRCWYVVGLQKEKNGQSSQRRCALCYAESENGFDWKKPSLGLHPFNGSKENNIVSFCFNGAAVFRDDSAPADERYKFFHFDKLEDVPQDARPAFKYGLYGVVSPDGYNWKRLPEPLIRHFCDTQNIGHWDSASKKYVGFFRGSFSGRAVTRSETEDFRKWPHPQLILYPSPEEHPADDYYTNGFTVYPDGPSLSFMFPAIYHHINDRIDVRLAVSHDKRVFNWVSRDPIIENGKLGEWDCASIYACPNLVRLPDGKLALPYMGFDATHNEWWFNMFYESFPCRTGYAWAMWDEGRLAGIEAPYVGEFFTRATAFEGESIEINARTMKVGRVEVELWEKECLDGFSFAENIPFSGDEIWARCRWRGKEDLSELKGRKIALHFRLTSAKIFGYRFV